MFNKNIMYLKNVIVALFITVVVNLLLGFLLCFILINNLDILNLFFLFTVICAAILNYKVYKLIINVIYINKIQAMIDILQEFKKEG